MPDTPANSAFGTDYSRYFAPVPGEASWIPFPRPVNEGQRVANARARAARAGAPIGSGYLNPGSGELQNPDRGFMTYIADHPWLGAAIALAPGALGALGAFGGAGGAAGGSASAAPSAGGLLTNTAAVGPSAFALEPPGLAGAGGLAGGGGIAGGSGVTAGSIASQTASGTSAINAIRKSLTSPEGIAGLAGLVASLATRSGGGGDSNSTDELRRIQGITEARMRRADPLHEVATQLAYQRAPIAAKAGIGLPRVPLP